MAISIEPLALLRLIAVMSPAFPTGGFAYSHGLEWAIDAGDVAAPEAARDWITSLLVHGSVWNDAVLFAIAYDADEVVRAEMDELAMALAASRERALETTDLGQSCARAVARMMPGDTIPFKSLPLVMAATCSKSCIDKRSGLLAFLQALTNNLIAVAVRLVPLGQNRGLEIMGDLMPTVIATVERAMTATLDDLGSSTFLSDIAAMKHETQYSRVYRS